MTKERSIDELRGNQRIGFFDKRGAAWHAANILPGESVPPFHYAGAVPMPEVEALLGSADVAESAIFIDTPLGRIEVPGRKAIYRESTGDVHGVFSDGYTIHQFSKLIDMVAPLLGGDVMVGSTGILKDGAIGYISLEVPESISIAAHGETFRPHLLLATSHDGSLATTIKRVVTRTVCDNTLSVALSEKSLGIKLKHTKYSLSGLKTASEALGLIEMTADNYVAEVEALTRIDVTDRAWSAFLNAHVPLTDDKGADKVGRSLTMATNERESLTELWNVDPRVSPWRGTGWGVLQAVNTYTHHVGIVRGMARSERNTLRAVTGGVDTLDRDTLATLTRVLATV